MSRFQKILKADPKTESQDLVVLEKGRTSKASLDIITASSNAAFEEFQENPEKYKQLVENPNLATSKEERIGIMSAREIIILIDKSGSMSGSDVNPQEESITQKKWSIWGGSSSEEPQKTSQKWTLWDSARVATESILEVSLAMDANHKIEITTFPAINEKGLAKGDYKLYETGSFADVQQIFHTQPGGSTPLADALESIKLQRLDNLLVEGTPFTVIIMTDGVPDNKESVKSFFVNLIKQHKLYEKGREYLAAFSFVQMGDDYSATQFLKDLDDNMASYYKKQGVPVVDIIDTKKDNFLFGTDEFKNELWKGPFALLHDAIFD